MSNSGTLLPPAVRFAKIVGTLGAGALAGAYLTHSKHILPALESTKESTTPVSTGAANISTQQPAAQAVKIFHRIHSSSAKFLLNVLLASAGSYTYVAYYLYNYPISSILTGNAASATTTFSSNSFIPHTSVSTNGSVPGEEFLGFAGTWMFFALPATLLFGIIPYSKTVLKAPTKRLTAAGESLAENEKRKTGLQVVDEELTWRDFDSWRKKNWVRAGLASAAGAIGAVGIMTVYG